MRARREAIALTVTVLAMLICVGLIYLPQARLSEGAQIATVPATCGQPTTIASLMGLREASGLVASRKNRDLLWSHNDSADATVFGINHDGAIKTRVHVTGATVDDWEAVTTGPCLQGSCLYVGDIGDNNGTRSRITIHRTIEPTATDTQTVPVETFAATYPEGPQDAEAMFTTPDGTLYIVTKGDGAPVYVYRVPTLTPGTVLSLIRIATLSADTSKTTRVTDAAVSPDGNWVVLRTNSRLFFYKTTDLTSGSLGTPREFDLETLKEPQGEGVAWPRDDALFLAGEGGKGGTFARVSCSLGG